jgi:hypothetical protein
MRKGVKGVKTTHELSKEVVLNVGIRRSYSPLQTPPDTSDVGFSKERLHVTGTFSYHPKLSEFFLQHFQIESISSQSDTARLREPHAPYARENPDPHDKSAPLSPPPGAVRPLTMHCSR